MRQTRRIRINAPVERVWNLIDDETKRPQWMPHVVATRFPDGKPKDNLKGTRFIQEMKEGEGVTAYEGEITEYQPGRMIAMMVRPQAFALHSVYHVEGDDDWTLLDYGCDVKPVTWRGYLMVWWGRQLLNSILDQQLGRLKRVAEGRQPETPTR
jgi:hypothetical protein